MRADSLFALDFGTTKFSIASFKSQVDGNTFEIKTVSVPARGMHRGMLSDVKLVEQSLSDLIDKAQKSFLISIDRVVLGVSGSHIRSFTHPSTIKIPKNYVTSGLLELFEQQVKVEVSQSRREVLHIVPLYYRIDDRSGIENPQGFSGDLLHGSFLVVDADHYYLKDMIKICNSQGIEVSRLIAEPLASATVTLSDHYKNVGVVLLDIGGGTSDGIIYVAGHPIRLFTINVAGKVITKDLCVGLNISETEAEQAKRHFGLNGNAVLDRQTTTRGNNPLTSQDVLPILRPRVDEFAALVNREIEPFRKMIGAGLVLTGGGAELKGLCEFLSLELKVHVQKLSPLLDELTRTPVPEIGAQVFAQPTELLGKNATVLGLLKRELDFQLAKGEIRFDQKQGSYLQRFFSWIKEMS